LTAARSLSPQPLSALLKAVEREVAPSKKIAKINKITTASPALGHLWGYFNTNIVYVAASYLGDAVAAVL
jgi:hypothetical protein